jgi:hypothetical protein
MYIASGSPDGKICIWELMTGKVITTKQIKELPSITALSFSQDSKQLVAASAAVFLLDVGKGELVAALFSGHHQWIWERSAFFHSLGCVKLWLGITKPFESEEDMSISTGIVKSVRSIFSYCFPFLMRDTKDVENGFAACPWTEAGVDEDEAGCPVSAFSADGRFVATCSAAHIYVWHANGELAGSLAGGPFSSV